MYILCIVLLNSFMYLSVDGAGSSCQDIDYNACVAMAKQNSEMCSDQVLGRTACPAFCKNCPITCYNCNTTTTDVSQCNTVTCESGEMCLLKTITGSGLPDKHRMMCGPNLLCSSDRKRNQNHLDKVDLNIRGTLVNLQCCDSDLCNSPQKSTTKPTTTSTTTTESTTSTTAITTTTTSTTSSPTSKLSVSQTPIYQYKTQQPNSCRRDIIIMIEESLDMALYFAVVKSAVYQVIEQLDIGRYKTRVGLGTFGHTGTVRWNLNSYMDKTSLLTAVYHLPQDTWTSNANNAVAVAFVLNNFSQGNRPYVPDDIIFITEGHTPHWFSQWRVDAAIKTLHQRSNNIISIALGAANQNEMQKISTDNHHYFYIHDILHYDQRRLVQNVVSLVDCRRSTSSIFGFK